METKIFVHGDVTADDLPNVGSIPTEKYFILIEKSGNGYAIVGSNIINDDCPELFFAGWDKDVREVEGPNCDWRPSSILLWREHEISFNLIGLESIEEISELVKHIVFSAWNPEDV